MRLINYFALICVLFTTVLCSVLASAHDLEQARTDSQNALLVSLVSRSVSSYPSARVRKSMNTATVNSTPINISFDTVVYDTGNFYASSAPDKITIPSSGLYYVLGQLTYVANATGVRKTNLILNDLTVMGATIVAASTGTDETSISAESTYSLVAGDFVRLQGLQGSGGALNIAANAGYSQVLSMVKLPN